MHSYSTDISNRPKILAGLGALCVVVILGVRQILPILSTEILNGFPLTAPSFALLFGVIYTGYNRWLWRQPILRKLGLVKVPDLNGTWTGYIETSYQGEIADDVISDEDDPKSEYTRIDATLQINQRWREIEVHFEMDTSSSDSRGATIIVNENMWPSLTYQYENHPPPNTVDSMQMHHGTADLELKNDDQILEGVYYTGPGRENHGEMFFRREN